MENTQEQPPQYILPAVQPHLAPSVGPNVRESYKSYYVKRLAMSQIVLGCMAVALQMWDCINESVYSPVGSGIWAGLFFTVTGCFGMHSANWKTVYAIVTYMVMSIISSLMAIGMLVVTSLSLSYYDSYGFYDWEWGHITHYMRTITIFLSTVLLLISVAEGFMAVAAASLACHGCCSTQEQGVLSYANPTQYVQGPNGQLLLVTGQQPNMVTNTSGQQVVITASPGGYQTVGLPIQGNYQTPGIQAQPYMSTEPIPTQQPMPQPESVQPPAYQQTTTEQAAGIQQPQVHQAAADGKTNYVM